MSPRTEPAGVAPPPPAIMDKAVQPGKPPPPEKKPATAAGMSGVVHQTTPAPEKTPPAQPLIRPGAAPIVPAPTLAHGGTDYVDKLTALVTNPDWEKLPPKVQGAVRAYVQNHHDVLDPIAKRLPLFGEIHDAEVSCTDAAAFGSWLQRQREPLKQFYAQFYRPVLGAPRLDLHPLTPEQRIDQRLASHQPITAAFVLAELRASPPRLRRHLVDQALLRMDFVEVGEIAKGVKGDDDLRGIVAAGLLQHAVAQQSQSLREGDRAHQLALCCAANATVAMAGASDKLGLLLSQMSEQHATLFAKALDGEQPRLESAALFDQLLAALNSAPRTAATSAIVQHLYLQAVPDDLTRAPGLAHAMAVAVAREWHPDDKAKAEVETARLEALQRRYPGLLFGGIAARKTIVFNALRSEPRITAELLARDCGDPARNRTVTNAMAHVMIATQRMMPFGAYEEDAAWRLGGILSIAAGPQLFFSDKVPAAARGQALAAIIAHPINSGSFKAGENAWLAPALAEPIAQLYGKDYRNDISQSLPGQSLDNMVGYAMGIAPTLPKGQEWQDLWNSVDGQAVAAKIAAGEPVTAKDLGDAYELLTGISFYAGHEDVAAIVEQVKHCANTDPPLVKLLPVIVFGENGPITCPLFRVQSGINGEGDPVYAYIDNAGRKYDSIEEWLETNRLPPGKVYYPADGHISHLTDGNGDMKLANAETPRTHQEIREALDTAAMVGCFAAGVVGVVVTGGALALVAAGVGTASGLWMAGRSLVDLHDRYTHGQSISPLDMDALGGYLGATGGLGGGVAFVGKAVRGAQLGKTAAFVVGVAHDAAAFAGTAGLVHQGGMIVKNWKDIPPEDRPKEVLKWLAFGGLTLAGAAKRQPTVETPRPPETPTTPPPTLPTARVVSPAPPSTGPTRVNMHGPLKLPGRPVVATPPMNVRPRSASGPTPFIYNGNPTWPVPTGPNELPANAGRRPPGGASPVAHDAATQPGPSGPAAAKQNRAPVDPNKQRMAGTNGDPPDGKGPPEGATDGPLNQDELAELADEVTTSLAELERQEAAGVVAPGALERYQAACTAFERAAARWMERGSRHLSDLGSALIKAIAAFNNEKTLLKIGRHDVASYGDALIELDRAVNDLQRALSTATPEQVRTWKPEIAKLRGDLENGVWQLAKDAHEARQNIQREMAKPVNQRSAENVAKWGDIIGKYEQVTTQVKNEPAKSLVEYVTRLIRHWGGPGVQDIASPSPRDRLGEAASQKMMDLEAARAMPEQDGKGRLVLDRLNAAREALGRYYDAVKSAAKDSAPSDPAVKRDKLALRMLINEYRVQNQELEATPNDHSRPIADGLLDHTGQLDPAQLDRRLGDVVDVAASQRSGSPAPISPIESQRLKQLMRNAQKEIDALKDPTKPLTPERLKPAREAIGKYERAVKAGGPDAEAHKETLKALTETLNKLDRGEPGATPAGAPPQPATPVETEVTRLTNQLAKLAGEIEEIVGQVDILYYNLDHQPLTEADRTRIKGDLDVLLDFLDRMTERQRKLKDALQKAQKEVPASTAPGGNPGTAPVHNQSVATVRSAEAERLVIYGRNSPGLSRLMPPKVRGRFNLYLNYRITRAAAQGATITVDQFLDMAAAASRVAPNIETSRQIIKLFTDETQRLGLTPTDVLPLDLLEPLTK